MDDKDEQKLFPNGLQDEFKDEDRATGGASYDDKPEDKPNVTVDLLESFDSKEDMHEWMLSYIIQEKLLCSSNLPSSTTTVNMSRKTWLVKFNGDTSEAYNVWRHQLNSLKGEQHTDRDICDAIRSSLQVQAAGVLDRMDGSPSIKAIFSKMDSIFGDVDTNTYLLVEFYSAKQRKEETVSECGCQLETILSNLQKQRPLP